MSEIRYFLVGGQLLGCLLVWPILWWQLRWWARRSGTTMTGRRAAVLAVPMALIVGLTLLRGTFGFHPGSMVDWSSTGWDRLSRDPFSRQVMLNVLLFLPAGVVYGYALRSFVRTSAALIGVAFVVESLQGLMTAGVPDPADLAANGAGGTLGALVGFTAAAAGGAVITREAVALSGLAGRWALALGLVVTATLLARVGADQRQDEVVSTLHDLFDASSLSQYREWQHASRGGGLDTHVFWPRAMPRSGGTDGSSVTPTEVVHRYPASYFGFRRCAFVTFGSSGTAVEPGSGVDCSRPMLGQ